MIAELKRLFVGQPLATEQLAHERLSKRIALAVFSSDAAITSAVRPLEPYRVELAIGLIGLVTLANLRGIKESGQIFAVPTYLFIFSTLGLIGAGLYQVITGQVSPAPPPAITHIPEQ